jgi:hypothetical protein
MNKLQSLIRLALAVLLMSVLACNKNGEGACDIGSGITIPNTYFFWIAQDFGCGPITVRVTDNDGYEVSSFYTVIRRWDASAPQCYNANLPDRAAFSLDGGKTYRYRATCSGKTWEKTFTVPCEQDKCYNIQLQ